ncbi:MAG: hypothetical protein RLY78_1983 [Pseudomonadota bacterium]|jgi:zinc/manganese transport system ATP-binding protein
MSAASRLGIGHGPADILAQGHPQAHGHAHDHGHDHPHGHAHDPGHRHAHGAADAAPADGPWPAEVALRVRDLTIAWRGHPAVHHLNGRFARGQLTAVVGPNGAGKSTLLGALAGQHPGHEGHVERAADLRLAWLPQLSAIDRSFPVRVDELVAMGLWAEIGAFGRVSAAQRQRIAAALSAVGLAGFERRWLGELSVGQAQRVLFARLVVQDAGLILLDEPFSAIDARTRDDLLRLLGQWRDEGRTVIAVLHEMEPVRLHFDETLLLAREAIAWGPTAEVLTDAHLRRARHMAEAWDEQASTCTLPPAAGDAS